jgi:hypothetical protein
LNRFLTAARDTNPTTEADSSDPADVFGVVADETRMTILGLVWIATRPIREPTADAAPS